MTWSLSEQLAVGGLRCFFGTCWKPLDEQGVPPGDPNFHSHGDSTHCASEQVIGHQEKIEVKKM